MRTGHRETKICKMRSLNFENRAPRSGNLLIAEPKNCEIGHREIEIYESRSPEPKNWAPEKPNLQNAEPEN